MATMKAISIHPEYVAEIAEGSKTEEYRTWPTKYRGELIICCTATPITYGYADLIAELYDCVKDEDGIYAFKLRNVRELKKFRVRGQQRIFNLEIPDELTIYNDDEQVTLDEYLDLFKTVYRKPPSDAEIESMYRRDILNEA